MAAATALALSSSAARQLSRSASAIFTREVSGSHKLTIVGYSPASAARKIPQAWWTRTQPFEAAGYSWRIKYFPNGRRLRNDDDECISLYLELAHGDGDDDDDEEHTDRPVAVNFKLSLLDEAGNPVPGHSSTSNGCFFWQHRAGAPIGLDLKWKDLHESGALKDDSFAIRCDITVIRDCPDELESNGGGGAPVSTVVAVPPSDLHRQLSDLLWKQKHGTDVAIDVAGETFDAHGWLLAARSPVLEAELQALSSSSKKEKEKEKVLKIKGMEPKVFRAMLHFMYTDVLPQDEQDVDDGIGIGIGVETATGLLAAAHRYKLERLKLLCEEALCRRIDVDTVAAILVAAEEHRCQALKAACAEFMARPGCMKAVVETRGFEEMKATCLPLLVDILVKQLTD